jgi:hypothetical protein
LFWEITETNFRFELQALDKHLCPNLWATPDAAAERDNLIRTVFPPDFDDTVCATYIVSRYPMHNDGLASGICVLKAHSIAAFRCIISHWPTCPSELTSSIPLDPDDDDQVDKLENAVATFYCQMFFNVYGRPPAVPHHVPLSASSHLLSCSFAQPGGV